jgi:prepilin-type N-terminal cleavage/methylation domain-containing protein
MRPVRPIRDVQGWFGRSPSQESGFSLIEVVVTIVLIAAMAMAVIPVISSGVSTYATTTNSLEALGKLRYATERLAREIREVRRNPVTPTDYEFTSLASSTSLQFRKSGGGVQVTITAASPDVRLGYSAPAVTGTLTDLLAANADLNLGYYLADRTTPTASLSLVAYVRISLTLTDRDANTVSQVTWVALRNQ